jgi:hypothetical protein
MHFESQDATSSRLWQASSHAGSSPQRGPRLQHYMAAAGRALCETIRFA